MWFERWIKGETIKQLAKASGYSRSKIQRVVLGYLPIDPTDQLDLSSYKYITFDGKFLFGREFCLLVVFDALTNRPIIGTVAKAESKPNITHWLNQLKQAGLAPVAVTTDGLEAGIMAFREIWPGIITQRCLFHIKLQVTAWCRIPPRIGLGKELSSCVDRLMHVDSPASAESFVCEYKDIVARHRDYINTLDPKKTTDKDLKKAVVLIDKAGPNMFHYLRDARIAKTTSPLEGYFKHIQNIRGFRHNGLTEQHLFDFIKWRIYFDSTK